MFFCLSLHVFRVLSAYELFIAANSVRARPVSLFAVLNNNIRLGTEHIRIGEYHIMRIIRPGSLLFSRP